MAIRIAAFAAFIAVGHTAAAAQEIGGRYRAEGTDIGGSNFSETAEIVVTDSTCRITWAGGGAGVCMLDGSTFSAGYIVHGKAGLAVYKLSSDGSMEGVFIDDFHGEGIGKEKLTPIR